MVELPTEAEPVRVVESDALAFLRSLPDGCADAVITDPPYNVGFAYSGDESGDRKADYREWCGRWLAELRRVCRGGIAVSVGMANLSMWAGMAPPDWWMCWHKPAAMGRCFVGFNNWEPVAVYGRPHKQTCDVIKAPIKPDAALKGHPCPKPLEWGMLLVERFCPPGGLVLDPFGGSGTVAVAAALEGRRCLLVEKEPAYAAIARKRVAEALGTGLFAGASA